MAVHDINFGGVRNDSNVVSNIQFLVQDYTNRTLLTSSVVYYSLILSSKTNVKLCPTIWQHCFNEKVLFIKS